MRGDHFKIMLQDDPELPDIACVIFDEFHERSLTADTGLALCLESQAALRPDLRLVVMPGKSLSKWCARLDWLTRLSRFDR